ncbi:MAG: flavodoxin family protein, partial [Oscillospiraceae bacterium]|nr:flavodoxin family protein [Oscillospiraceae bacterium]
MRLIGVNGSPRKNGNTAAMLDQALNGARAQGAQTERIDLYDLKYTGCRSCFECKRLGGRSFGRCALKDGLTGALEKALGAQALIVASPIYFGDVTGQTRSFFERLCFPSL